jgi:hypothetical protein
MKKDCKWSVGPEVRGRRTLQELSVETPVWQYETGASNDAELAAALADVEFWTCVVRRDSTTAVVPADWPDHGSAAHADARWFCAGGDQLW